MTKEQTFPPGHIMTFRGRLIDPLGLTRAFDLADSGEWSPLSRGEPLKFERDLDGVSFVEAGYEGWAIYRLEPADLADSDIAHGLSHEPRYSGQCREFLSVAQHACHVAGIAASLALNAAATPVEALMEAAAGLHHDDPEGLGLHDWGAPLKRLHATALAGVIEASEDMERLIERRFHLAPGACSSPIVRRADYLAHAYECQLMRNSPRWPTNPWPNKHLVVLTSREARRLWLQTSRDLAAAITAHSLCPAVEESVVAEHTGELAQQWPAPKES